MTADISELNPNKANPETVKLLEAILEEAKEGRVVALAIAGVYTQGQTMEAYVVDMYPQTLVGTLEILKKVVMDNNIEM